MRVPFALLAIAAASGNVLPAQVFIPSLGQPVNSASYSQTIAQGSIFTVFGFGIGPAQLLRASSYPLPFDIGGTSIAVISSGRTYNCPMIFASNQQAAAVLPSGVPAGRAEVRLTYAGQTGFGWIDVAVSSFGIYTPNSSGVGPGTITGTDYTPKTFDKPARPGEAVILWGTGLGPIDSSDRDTPIAGKQFPDVEVFAGNLPAWVLYAGRSGCCAGLDQIVFEVPGSAAGCFVPIVVRTGGLVSNFVTLAVEPSGAACVNAAPGVPSSILSRALAGEELTYAEIALGPIRVLQSAGFSFSQGLADRLSALLRKRVADGDVRRLITAYRAKKRNTIAQLLARYGINPKRIDPRVVRTVQSAVAMDQQGIGAAFGRLRNLSAYSPLFAANFTSVGSCTVTQGFPRLSPPRSTGLDAGSILEMDGPAGRRGLQRISNGQYLLSLGGGFQNGTLPLGLYRIAGSGGRDIGPFSASIDIGSALTWTNKAAVSSLDRTQPLTVTWAGGPVPGHVLIAGGSHKDGASTAFICVEDSRKGTFTIPSFVLAALTPVSSSDGLLFIAPHPLSNRVSIPGVDIAYIAAGHSDYKALPVR